MNHKAAMAKPKNRMKLMTKPGRSSFFMGVSLALALCSCLQLSGQSCTTAVCNAAGTSQAQVLAALPSPSNSNSIVTVNIPSGTGLWTGQISYTIPAAVTNLTIQGNTTVSCSGTPGVAGYSCSATDNTIIRDNDSASGNDSMLKIYGSGVSGANLRITGITFQNGTGTIKYYGLFLINGVIDNLRLDHLHIDQTINSAVADYGIGFFGAVQGVVDHNLFSNTSTGSNQLVQGMYIANTLSNDLYGDGIWASPTNFGGSNFLFVESNYFYGGVISDCDIGGRFVTRYNTADNQSTVSSSIHTHGTKSPGSRWRSCRAYEAYHNTLTGNTSTANASIGSGGGPSLVWGNTNGGHYNNFAQIAAPRNDAELCETATPNGWGFCGNNIPSGCSTPANSNWDGNSNSTGYPCLDGLGKGQGDLLNNTNFPSAANTVTGTISWPHQKLEPIYYFNNTLGGINELVISDISTQLNRDVYIDNASFNGTTGTGKGLLSARPSTCTAGPGGTYGSSPTGSYGVAYFATDANSGNGELYVCTATNTWTPVYQPYTYPHPLVGGSGVSLTVTATHGAISGPNCSTGTYTAGTTVGPCIFTPDPGYTFTSGWVTTGSASCSGTGTCGSFNITATTTISATGSGAGGSTPATGDTRTVTEPTFPTPTLTVKATKFIVQTNALNIDPYNPTCGSTGGTNGILGCTGGTSYEPSSSSSSYLAAESLDNTLVNGVLSSCAGGTVEFIPGDHGELGFVMAPWAIPGGCKIILDAGIHVFASRNRSDYGGTNCGIVTTGSSSCNHWITSPNTTGSGIYGYGVLDGRGWDTFIGRTDGFYYNRIQAYCNNHGGAINGSPACTPNGAGNNSYGPNGLNLVGANNFTLYKTTIKDSGNFIFNWQSGNGLTAWGAKLFAPFEVSNTDGFDPLNSINGTFNQGYISNGDNHVAVKAKASTSKNITVSNTQTGAGIALAIGTDINSAGISNVLFTNLVQRGNLRNSQSSGIQIGSSSANGGVVNQVTFQNDCMVNEQNSIRLYTNYGGQSGTSIPNYTNILLRNIHVLPSTAPYTTGNSGTYTFQGLSGTPIQVQLDNVQIDGVNQGVASQSGVTKDQYSNIFLGPGPVDSSLPPQFAAGTSVITSGTPGSGTAYPCTTSTWKPLVGDLNLKTVSSNNNQSYTVTAPSPAYTLQAVLQPATAINNKESPALTQPVTFLDNGVSIGTAPLAGDGSFAQFTVSTPPTSGAHIYTAQYPGDSNYPSFTFGSVLVTISGAPVCSDPTQLSPNFSGTYTVPPATLPMTVGFVSGTAGCTMHYTSDGSAPTCSSTAYPGGNLTISATGTYTYRAIACQSGYTSSNVVGGTWQVNPASSVTVTLSGTQISGASIQ